MDPGVSFAVGVVVAIVVLMIIGASCGWMQTTSDCPKQHHRNHARIEVPPPAAPSNLGGGVRPTRLQFKTEPSDQRWEAAARRRMGDRKRGEPVHSGDPRLFDYTKDLDPLAKNDVDPRDIYPVLRGTGRPPKNSNEAIAQMYTADNMTKFVIKNRGWGSETDRDGWKRYGPRRDLQHWAKIQNLHREHFAKHPERVLEIENSMAPSTEHALDMAIEPARRAGIIGQEQYPGSGLNNRDVAKLTAWARKQIGL
jgi:hypothetical protein